MKFDGLRDAHDFLDAVRDGMAAQQHDIDQALFVTGDLEADEAPIVRRYFGVGEWERKASLAPMRRADVFDALTV